MKIYIAHSREFDYKNELYKPLHKINEHEIILPHEKGNYSTNTRDFYKTIDIMIAECSYPSIGLGIELGWAFDDNVPVYIIYKKGKIISSSIEKITGNIFEYEDSSDMVKIMEEIINNQKKLRGM